MYLCCICTTCFCCVVLLNKANGAAINSNVSTVHPPSSQHQQSSSSVQPISEVISSSPVNITSNSIINLLNQTALPITTSIYNQSLPLFSAAKASGNQGDNGSGNHSNSGNGVWAPPGNVTEADWLRCHGINCTDWHRVRMKLLAIKASVYDDAPFGFDLGAANATLQNFETSHDQLDKCIWLTEPQCDEIIEHLRLVGPERRRRQVADFVGSSFRQWPLPIRWKFDGTHNNYQRDIVRGAFRHWSANTCVRFEELQPGTAINSNHILITSDNTGCHSFVGMVTVIPQQLNLQAACLEEFGIAVHEIGHALGLWHEQQRSDRDDSISINWQNVGTYVGQFYKHFTVNVVPYDIGSVMHYGPQAGSSNGDPTMACINPQYQSCMGQRTGLSFLDAKAINLVYCNTTCATHPPLSQSCQHGGYQDPNNCSQCRCPDGFSGPFCNALASPAGAQCGGTINLPAAGQVEITSPGYNVPMFYDDFTECNWLIKAPANQKVRLYFDGPFGVYCRVGGVCYHWVEVRYRGDMGGNGPRYCCATAPGATAPLISDGQEMLVLFRANFSVWSRDGLRGFKAIFDSYPQATTLAPTATTAITRSLTTPQSYADERYDGQQVHRGDILWQCHFDDVNSSLCGLDQRGHWTTGAFNTPNGTLHVASSTSTPNDTSILYLPRFGYFGAACVSFNYLVDTLPNDNSTLQLVSVSLASYRTLLWQRSSARSRSRQTTTSWRLDYVDIHASSFSQLAFVNAGGSVALNDVTVYTRPCNITDRRYRDFTHNTTMTSSVSSCQGASACFLAKLFTVLRLLLALIASH